MSDVVYLGKPMLLEVKSQFNELMEMTKGISTINQIKELQGQYLNDLEIEVNGDVLTNYNEEDTIDVIRYDFKNIMVYVYVKGCYLVQEDEFSIFNNEGRYITDVTIGDIDEALAFYSKKTDIIPEDKDIKTEYKVVLHHNELEIGLSKSQILSLLDKLQMDSHGYMPIEFHAENSSAYGFICSSYYEELSYNDSSIAKVIEPILSDWNNESDDYIYKLEDGTEVYMACDYETL